MGKIIFALLVPMLAMNATYGASTSTQSSADSETAVDSGYYPGTANKTQQEKDAMKKARRADADSKSEKSDANTSTDTTKSKTAPKMDSAPRPSSDY